LVASIAHEINQPLAAISTNAGACLNWLDQEKPDLDEVRDSALLIEQSASRASEVIRGVRALVSRSEPQLTMLDINDAVGEVLALSRSELQRHGVALRTDMAVGDCQVFGDRVQLQQVFLNLIMNGVEAMGAVTDRPKLLAITTRAVDTGEMHVTVEDTGTGLDRETASRVFEPFFTTKPNGMGMGLSICRSIIEAHGGRLWASQRLPYGTAFQFTVRRAEAVRQAG
jgi:C4-dicarboxylate-specific signal transduction histidine kinase